MSDKSKILSALELILSKCDWIASDEQLSKRVRDKCGEIVTQLSRKKSTVGVTKKKVVQATKVTAQEKKVSATPDKEKKATPVKKETRAKKEVKKEVKKEEGGEDDLHLEYEFKAGMQVEILEGKRKGKKGHLVTLTKDGKKWTVFFDGGKKGKISLRHMQPTDQSLIRKAKLDLKKRMNQRKAIQQKREREIKSKAKAEEDRKLRLEREKREQEKREREIKERAAQKAEIERRKKEQQEEERRLFEADLKEKQLAAASAAQTEKQDEENNTHHKINLSKLGLDPSKIMHGVGPHEGIPGRKRSHSKDDGSSSSVVFKSTVEHVQGSEALMNRATPAKKQRRRPQRKKFTPAK